MNDAVRREHEAAFRTDAARLVQAMRHHIRARYVPVELAPMVERVRRLESLLEADAPTAHLLEVAQAVVDTYDGPRPEISSNEGPVVNAAILAAVERLRDAMDALDAMDDDDM